MKFLLIICLSLLATLSAQAQRTKTVNNLAGDLANRLSDEEKANVTNLTITGTMDQRDFQQIKSMKKIALVNLQGVSKVEAYDKYPADEIPAQAFASNLTLTSVVLPPSVSTIGRSAFSNSKIGYGESLTSIVLTGNITAIGEHAFRGNINLIGFPFQASLQTLGTNAFSYTGLRNADLRATQLTEIPYSSFTECPDLKTIKWPKGLTSIGQSAFAGSGLAGELRIPSTVIAGLESNIFRSTNITAAVLPEGLEIIPSQMFAACKKLTSVNIPESVYEIGNSAFSGTGFERIQLPAGLATIRETAFSHIQKLKAIELPKDLVVIERGAFQNCSTLVTIVAQGTVPIDLSTSPNVFHGIPDTATLYVPAGSIDSYKAAAQWSNFKRIKAIGDDPDAGDIKGFTNISVEKGAANVRLKATAIGNRPVTYSIETGKDAVATLTGQTLAIHGEGTAQITAKAAANSEYQESFKTITLTVINYDWLAEVAIAVHGNSAKLIGKAESVAKFSKFYINDAEVPLTDAMADLTDLEGELQLKATTADGSEIVRLIISK